MMTCIHNKLNVDGIEPPPYSKMKVIHDTVLQIVTMTQDLGVKYQVLYPLQLNVGDQPTFVENPVWDIPVVVTVYRPSLDTTSQFTWFLEVRFSHGATTPYWHGAIYPGNVGYIVIPNKTPAGTAEVLCLLGVPYHITLVFLLAAANVLIV